jgi:hypothetical protein
MEVDQVRAGPGGRVLSLINAVRDPARPAEGAAATPPRPAPPPTPDPTGCSVHEAAARVSGRQLRTEAARVAGEAGRASRGVRCIFVLVF